MASNPGTQLAPVGHELAQKMSQFEAALIGSGISPKRFVRVVLTAVNLNPELLRCDRRSLMNAAMKAANDHLLPDGNDGALVPFDGKVTWMPQIAGIRKKVRRAGEITSWDVTAVFAKDMFDFELGDNPFIKHKPWMAAEPPERKEGEEDSVYNRRVRAYLDRGPLTHVYSVAKLKGGDLSRDVMSRVEVELVRDTYARKNKNGEFSPAWRKSFPEMAKKTVARRHSKQLPMSTDLLNLLHRDDELYDVERERGERVEAPRELSARLDALVGVDPETGEFPPDEGDHDSVSVAGEASTPLSPQSAAPHDTSVRLGDDGGEGAAHKSGASSPPTSSGQGGGQATPVTAAAPVEALSPGAEAVPTSDAPGGQLDLLRTDLFGEGESIARQKGRDALERWVNELPPDEMARISLAQLKTWRAIAGGPQ